MLQDSNNRIEHATGALTDPGTVNRRFDLLPASGLREVAIHFGDGANKYPAHNWRKGIKYSIAFDKLISHAYRWNEKKDDEHHMRAVAFWALALLEYEATGRTDLDDRFIPESI